MPIWYILWSFGIFLTILVCSTKKNLATCKDWFTAAVLTRIWPTKTFQKFETFLCNFFADYIFWLLSCFAIEILLWHHFDWYQNGFFSNSFLELKKQLFFFNCFRVVTVFTLGNFFVCPFQQKKFFLKSFLEAFIYSQIHTVLSFDNSTAKYKDLPNNPTHWRDSNPGSSVL
jgi:hypothetical protein